MSHTRKTYMMVAIAVIALGILSRAVTTGYLLFDKYLGDALYAVLLYLLLRIWQPDASRRDHANWAMVIVFAIELFQLTGVPLAMRQSESFVLKLASVVLGTQFAWYDIVAYAVGILGGYFVIPSADVNMTGH